ncbi:MAG: flagellar biosynthetic protein FliR, partial [Proteobacteria bacterium]|nr:flagellar biosynthetic protein FliR [Pseudomonadota bacterium]
ASLLSTMAVVMMFVTDLHHLMLRALADSYTLFTPGGAPMVGDMTNLVARHVADAFALGLQLSAPMLLVALVYYIGLGILGRLMPTLQVFFFGLPFQISAQFWVLMVTLSGIMLEFMQRFGAAFVPFLAP